MRSGSLSIRPLLATCLVRLPAMSVQSPHIRGLCCVWVEEILVNDKSSFAEALTFDDVLLAPGYSETLPGEVNLGARQAGDLRLNIPVLSAAMDTVTEAQLAIALARAGGIGVIHRNMSAVDQAKEVD